MIFNKNNFKDNLYRVSQEMKLYEENTNKTELSSYINKKLNRSLNKYISNIEYSIEYILSRNNSMALRALSKYSEKRLKELEKKEEN